MFKGVWGLWESIDKYEYVGVYRYLWVFMEVYG